MVNTIVIVKAKGKENYHIEGFIPYKFEYKHFFISNGFERSNIYFFKDKIKNRIGSCWGWVKEESDPNIFSIGKISHIITKVEIHDDGILVVARLLNSNTGLILKKIIQYSDPNNLPISFYISDIDNIMHTINISLNIS